MKKITTIRLCTECSKKVAPNQRYLDKKCETCYRKRYRKFKVEIKKCPTCYKQFQNLGQQVNHKFYCSKECKRAYHRSKHTAYQQLWAQDNREKTRASGRRAYQKAYQNPAYRLKIALITRLRFKIKNRVLSCTRIVLDNLGCTIKQLMHHLQSLFQPGMTWDNYGKYGWHVDHKIPLANFNLTNSEQLQKACHYKNLQPMWARDNLSKGKKYGSQQDTNL